jgi:hypothetical protein
VRFILILSPPTFKSFQWPLSSWFSNRKLYAFHFFPIHATYSAHLIIFDIIVLIIPGEDYKLLSSSLCSVLQTLIISFLFSPNILLSTRFSNTLTVCYFFNIRGQVSHQHETASKIVILYNLIITFVDSRREEKRFSTEWQQIWPEFNMLLISPQSNFDLLLSFPNILTSPYFQRIFVLRFSLHSSEEKFTKWHIRILLQQGISLSSTHQF